MILVIFFVLGLGISEPDTKPERVLLDNGVTLLLAPLPESSIVAVESFYPVGFVDEPAGLTQVAHLMEHLMVQGATKSFALGESFNLLRKMGMANAETLPTFTHYDYAAPPNELATILKIEGERLTSLSFTPELISEEGDKCHEEADFVYGVPASGMVKHAFMAFFQFWNHEATEVRVRRGVDTLPKDRVMAFYREHYRPDQLTLAIVGKFTRTDAITWAKEHLGSIESRKTEPKRLQWDTLPASVTVTWDADVYAVCVYAAPPSDAKERGLLSLWGTALFEPLAADPVLKEHANMSFVSNTTWPVGELPFFLYATAKTKDAVPRIEQAMKDFLRNAPDKLGQDIATMRTLATQLGGDPVPPWGALQKQAATFAKSSGRSEPDAMGMVLTNVALQWGLRELNGWQVEADHLNEQLLRVAVERTTAPSRIKVVHLAPPPESPTSP